MGTPRDTSPQQRLQELNKGLERIPGVSKEGFFLIGENMGHFSGNFAAGATQADTIRERIGSGNEFGLAPMRNDLKKIQNELTRAMSDVQGLIDDKRMFCDQLEQVVNWAFALEQDAFLPPVSDQLRKGGSGELEIQTLASIIDNLMRQTRPLIQEIVTSCQTPLDLMNQLGRRLGSDLESSENALSTCRQNAQSALRNMARSVKRIEEACVLMDERARRVNPIIFEMVGAMQYDDITAQRILHVVETLNQAADKLSASQQKPARRFAVTAMRIAIDQLEECFSDLIAALHAIRSHLTRLADMSREQADAVADIRRESRVFRQETAEMAFNLSGILNINLMNDALSSEVVRTISHAESGLFQSKRSIMMLQMTCRRLGELTAELKAKDRSGKLEILTDSIAELATRVNQEIPGKLEKVDENIALLYRISNNHSEKAMPRLMRLSSMLRRVPYTTQQLDTNNLDLLSVMNDILSTSQGTFIQVMLLMAEMNFHEEIRMIVDRGVGVLGKMVVEVGGDLPEASQDDISTLAAEFSELFALYTMESERKTHEEILGIKEDTPPEEDDLGFELF